MRAMLACALSLVWGCGVVIAQETDLEGFWERGHVRELLVSGLPSDDAGLKMWADCGVNCVTGIKPELAHKYGLKTRTWFTMNYMNSRARDLDSIKSMAAINRDGTYRRPNDPLFPSIAQYGWSACVNNPLWVQDAQNVFRNSAKSGYDGCHIDYAGHYEPCFCEHCKAAWGRWAEEHGMSDTDLEQATDATDLRTRMLLREFRIRCVMRFLGGLRDVARRERPGFATDGTWHQDNGSAYQWAYGDHFDLMCIEGTTHGPFPPEGTQVLFLKLAHVLSDRPGHRPVAMSVTYHLLRDEEGALHHGRMAPDRLRVALGEIISQGAVSWLGLGGPKTGSLLREHQDIVKAYYSHARDIEPVLAGGDQIAQVGIVFSPKSFLFSGGQRTQLYAIGQALMKTHVPFRILSDLRLEAGDLEGLQGVMLLDAQALSDAACKALEVYVRQGGRVVVLGDDAATLTEDWRERSPRPQFAIPPKGSATAAQKPLGKGMCHYWLGDPFAGLALGAAQFVPLNHDKPLKLAIEGYSKAEGVSGNPDSNYSLYVDLHHADGTPLWGRTAQFATGTHDWQLSRTIIQADRPFKNANVHMLFRGHRGTVYFRDVKFGVWNEEKQQIEKNLLADRFTLASGETYSAAPGENAQTGAWGPYRDGYELENMLDMGLWVKMASTKGLSVTGMTGTDDIGLQAVLDAVAPLRAGPPILTAEGEGEDKVYVEPVRCGDEVLLKLLNYAAELHPELPEFEQQKADRSIPAKDLSITLSLPGLRLDANRVKAYFPEAEPAVNCEPAGNGVRLTVGELRQYGVISIGLEQ